MAWGREPKLATTTDRPPDGTHYDGGGSALIRGEAGLGTSALLDEAQARAAERGIGPPRIAGAPSESQMDGLSFAAVLVVHPRAVGGRDGRHGAAVQHC